jgi:hypothetical protein
MCCVAAVALWAKGPPALPEADAAVPHRAMPAVTANASRTSPFISFNLFMYPLLTRVPE